MLELYDNLMKVCAESDESKFFFKDQVSPFGTKFRVFSYHYASYSDWLQDDALECRGIMFEMDGDVPVRIACRPMEKFFNLNETPFTMGLDLSEVELVMTKEDGSLISSFVDHERLNLKSKTSMFSQQAAEALQVIKADEALEAMVLEMAVNGYTCNFEYTSPTNRVVLAYQERKLTLLNVRNNKTGEYIPHKELFKMAVLRPYLVEAFHNGLTEEDIVSIRKAEGIEGYVVKMTSGLHFKLKCDWYCALHHTKDSITNNERLFGTIVAGASDDLKGMFSTDSWAIEKIEAFEETHRNYLKEGIETILSLYQELKGKDRKFVAITAQQKLNRRVDLFSILMNMYGRGPDIDLVEQLNKAFLKQCKNLVPQGYETVKIVEE